MEVMAFILFWSSYPAMLWPVVKILIITGPMWTPGTCCAAFLAIFKGLGDSLMIRLSTKDVILLYHRVNAL